MRGIILCFFISLVAGSTFAQQNTPTRKRERFPSYFGISASPVFPTNFIGSKTTSFTNADGNMDVVFNQQLGFSFGATVRIGLTKTISLETGIFQVRRNFDVNVAVPDSGVNVTEKLGFVNYDVPINGLFYVRLSDKMYMNASLGISINHYPSDVHHTVELPFRSVTIEGRRIKRTYFSANASIGFELRTEKSGTFYIGGSGKVPFLPLMFGVGILKQSGNGNLISAYAPITGGYLSADFRYFLPQIKKKGTQFKSGPIEQ